MRRRPVERRCEPRAAVELRRVAPALIPLAGRDARWWCSRRPWASSSSQPRSRGHSRSNASCATSASSLAHGHQPAVRKLESTCASPGSRSISASGSRRRTATPSSPTPARRSSRARARRPRLGLELVVHALGESRDRASHAPGVLVCGQRESRPSRCCHSSSSAVWSSGRAPGSPSTSVISASTSSASTCRPARCDGQHDRAAQLVAAHRADRDVAGAEHPPQLGVARAAPVEVGAQGDQHERATARVAHGGDQRVHERGPLGLVVAGGEQLLELVDGDHEAAVRRCLRPPARGRRADERRGAGARSPSPHSPAGRRAGAPAAIRPSGPTICRCPRARRCPAAACPRSARPSRRRAARGRRRRRRRRRRSSRGP